MSKLLKNMGLAAGMAGLLAGGAMPAAASTAFTSPSGVQAVSGEQDAAHNGRDYRDYRNDRRYQDSRYGYNNNSYRQSGYRGEPVYNNTRTWRGNDGRYYCKKKDGTTGLIIGGAVGALLGRQIDGGYNRSLGTILGAAGGALLGREVSRSGSRCN